MAVRGGNDTPLDRRTLADVEAILRRLPGMERAVVELRFGLMGGHPLRSAEVAQRLGLTARETSEIERRALDRLQQLVDRATLQRLLVRFAAKE